MPSHAPGRAQVYESLDCHSGAIPRAVLRQLGFDGDQVLLVKMTDEGAIVLRPTGAYPLELYGDERIRDADGSASGWLQLGRLRGRR